ncbi:MAG TPA: EamA family transporter [Candidatus Acidoferrales bacterium]|nr:EamA family transporter [Candidatus Acidoferrales bacterium]
MDAHAHRSTWKTLLAFAIIYLVWGSTYLAIRIGVREFPPLLMAALRFIVAGAVLYAWAIARGEQSPDRRQWSAIALLAVLFFVCDYGLLFWAEKCVPSGITAVMMATIPLFIALCEITLLRTQTLTLRLALALLAGIAGVAVLASRSSFVGGAPVNPLGALALIFASLSWAVGTVLMRRLSLPSSKVMSSGTQMLAGGILLSIASAGFGEFGVFHPAAISRAAWFSLLYLIVAGSIVAFTAYLWLVHHESPTKVGTYAYVNPVVAVLIGYFFAGESLGIRTILGTLLVLVSVVAITTARTAKPAASVSVEAGAKAATETVE